jgi:hypothetical protein
MPRNQDGRDREAESLRRSFRSQRAWLESGQQPAERVDHALWEQTAIVGRQLGRGFEPDESGPAPVVAAGRTRHMARAKAPRRSRRVWLLIAWAMTLAVALLLGYAMGSARTAAGPTRATVAARPPTARPAPAPSPSVVVREIASSACLETAKRADEIIHLFNRDRREEAAELLLAYTVASQQCRKDADP